MSLRVLLSFLLASFLPTSCRCTRMFVEFGWAMGEMYCWSHTSRTWEFGCFPGVRMVWFLLAIELKLNAVFVTFFIFSFFIFFLNHMIIVYGYKILHAAHAMA